MKKIFCLFLALLFFSPLVSQGKGKASSKSISARQAFVDMPSSILDLLPRATRLNMLDYYDNDSIIKAMNNLQGDSYLDTVSQSFLSVRLTPVSSMQFKVLPLKSGGDILMIIYTVGHPDEMQESEISFYDADFNPLDKEKYFKTPKWEIFFDTRGYKTRLKELEEILPYHAQSYTACAADNTLRGRLTVDDALTIEDNSIIQMFLKPGVSFVWNGKEFKLQNN